MRPEFAVGKEGGDCAHFPIFAWKRSGSRNLPKKPARYPRISRITSTGTLPTGLLANTTYYVINAVTDAFNVAATQGGAAISTSGGQSGSHIVREVVSVTVS